MQQRETIHQYLKSLSKYLARLDKTEAEEVVKEIESHIFDALEHQEQSGAETDLETILSGFGDPRDLAQQYVEHVLDGTPPPAGFKAIQTVKKSVASGLVYSMAVFGFTVSVVSLLIAVAKIFFPDAVGIWSTANGNSFVVGFVEQPYQSGKELLGYWIIPVGIMLSAVSAEITRRVIKALSSSK